MVFINKRALPSIIIGLTTTTLATMTTTANAANAAFEAAEKVEIDWKKVDEISELHDTLQDTEFFREVVNATGAYRQFLALELTHEILTLYSQIAKNDKREISASLQRYEELKADLRPYPQITEKMIKSFETKAEAIINAVFKYTT